MTKTTTTVILQGCPFCGGKARMTSLRRGRFTRTGTNHQVLCNTCKARGPLVPDDVDQAARLWNRAPAGLASHYQSYIIPILT